MDQVVGGVDAGHGLRQRRGIEKVSAHHLRRRPDPWGERCGRVRGFEPLGVAGQDPQRPACVLDWMDQPSSDVAGAAGEQDEPCRLHRAHRLPVARPYGSRRYGVTLRVAGLWLGPHLGLCSPSPAPCPNRTRRARRAGRAGSKATRATRGPAVPPPSLPGISSLRARGSGSTRTPDCPPRRSV